MKMKFLFAVMILFSVFMTTWADSNRSVPLSSTSSLLSSEDFRNALASTLAVSPSVLSANIVNGQWRYYISGVNSGYLVITPLSGVLVNVAVYNNAGQGQGSFTIVEEDLHPY